MASDNSRKYMDYVLQRSLRGELQEVVKAVLAWDGSSEALTLLSAGDDHGIFAIALCQALPKLKADVLESHGFAKATKDMVGSYDLGDKIKVKKGDIFGDIAVGYDIVIASHLLYQYRDDLQCALSSLAKSRTARAFSYRTTGSAAPTAK